jgi:hypothetical protein
MDNLLAIEYTPLGTAATIGHSPFGKVKLTYENTWVAALVKEADDGGLNSEETPQFRADYF